MKTAVTHLRNERLIGAQMRTAAIYVAIEIVIRATMESNPVRKNALADRFFD